MTSHEKRDIVPPPPPPPPTHLTGDADVDAHFIHQGGLGLTSMLFERVMTTKSRSFLGIKLFNVAFPFLNGKQRRLFLHGKVLAVASGLGVAVGFNPSVFPFRLAVLGTFLRVACLIKKKTRVKGES